MEDSSFGPFAIPKNQVPQNNNSTMLIIILICIIICSYLCISICGSIGYFFYNKKISNDDDTNNACSIMCGNKCLKPGELCNEQEITSQVPEITSQVQVPEITSQVPIIDPVITRSIPNIETTSCNSPDNYANSEGSRCWIKDTGETCCGTISGPASCSDFISAKAQIGNVINGECVANNTDPICVDGSNESINQQCTIYTYGSCCKANNSECTSGISGKIGRTTDGIANCIKTSSVISGKTCNDDSDCNCLRDNTNCEYTCQRDTDSSPMGTCLTPHFETSHHPLTD